MSKHTPGPWQFHELRGDDGLGYIRPNPQDYLEIAHHGDTGRSAEENRANARLISAAPELLEALELCINQLERDTELLYDQFTPWAEIPTALEKARAAIAKAEGETQ